MDPEPWEALGVQPRLGLGALSRVQFCSGPKTKMAFARPPSADPPCSWPL